MLLILTILIFQHSLYSQKEIVGKVEFYKSVESKYRVLESSPDVTIRNLTNRKHKIKIHQKDSIYELETDSIGIFKFRTDLKNSIRIKVNDDSSFFNETFNLNLNEIRDTLKLRISDKKLAVYRDSIIEPEFYKNYNEKQAKLDFKNDKRQLLWYISDWMSEEYLINQKKNHI